MEKAFASFPEIPWYVALGLIVALCSLLVSIRNYRLSSRKAQAEREGARLPANLSLIVYTARISGSANYEPPRHFILTCHCTPGRYIDLPFVADVENLGQRTASDVSLYLRYPRRLRLWTGGTYEGASVTVTADDALETVRMKMGDLHPGDTWRVLDHFSITESVLHKANGPVAFSVEFKVAQRDDIALEGTISFVLIDVSIASPKEALSSLSKILPAGNPPKPKQPLDRFFNGLAGSFARVAGRYMTIGHSVVMVSYNKRLIVAEQGQPIDHIPPEALLLQAGVQDRRGHLWFPGVNARDVFLFHGKIAPEVAGLGGREVANPGLRRMGR